MQHVFSAAARLLAVLRVAVAGLVIVFFTYMLIAVLVQVLGRYFVFSIDWAAETATLAQVWMVFLAAGMAMREQLHVRVDALVNLLPPWLIRVLAAVVALCCLAFISLAVRGSLALVEVGTIQTSPVLGLPMWIAFLSVPVGLSYFAVELVVALITKGIEGDDETVQTGGTGGDA